MEQEASEWERREEEEQIDAGEDDVDDCVQQFSMGIGAWVGMGMGMGVVVAALLRAIYSCMMSFWLSSMSCSARSWWAIFSHSLARR